MQRPCLILLQGVICAFSWLRIVSRKALLLFWSRTLLTHNWFSKGRWRGLWGLLLWLYIRGECCECSCWIEIHSEVVWMTWEWLSDRCCAIMAHVWRALVGCLCEDLSAEYPRCPSDRWLCELVSVASTSNSRDASSHGLIGLHGSDCAIAAHAAIQGRFSNYQAVRLFFFILLINLPPFFLIVLIFSWASWDLSALKISLNELIFLDWLAEIVDVLVLESFKLMFPLEQGDPQLLLLGAQTRLIHIVVGIEIHVQKVLFQDDFKVEVLLLDTSSR